MTTTSYEITLLFSDAAWETSISGLSNMDAIGTTLSVSDFPLTPTGFLDAVSPQRPHDDVIVYTDGSMWDWMWKYDDGGAGPDRDYNDMIVGVVSKTHKPEPPGYDVPLPAGGEPLVACLLAAAWWARRAKA